MTGALIIAEHDGAQLSAANLAVITAARELSSQVAVLLAGVHLKDLVTQAQQWPVDEIIVADHLAYEHMLAENMAALCSVVAKDYQYVLASANTFGKNILPRVAAILDVDMVSEVIRVIDAHTFVRPIYAGNAQETVRIDESLICLTVRPTAFAPATLSSEKATIKTCDTVCDLQLSTFIALQQEKTVRPELTQARIVVAGGRGVQSKENFQLIEQLANALGAAVGATRAAVDAGFVANEYQVGQTGKVVAPDLYIAVGISGAAQHVAGMKDSKVIVAINKDKEAPIFQMADYGLVGDLFDVVPELIAAVKK